MNYTAYYFLKDDAQPYNCRVVASSRIEAINLFDELYPERRLISLVPVQ